MTTNNFQQLDQHLSANHCDSLKWNQGGQFEIAEEILAKFAEADWLLLAKNWQSKNNSWKRCLIGILTPYYGSQAQDLIINMASIQNPEIAMEAMYAISFYCGVNENADGVYLDSEIAHLEFKNRLVNSQFAASIGKIEKLTGEKFTLLQKVLLGKS